MKRIACLLIGLNAFANLAIAATYHCVAQGFFMASPTNEKFRAVEGFAFDLEEDGPGLVDTGLVGSKKTPMRANIRRNGADTKYLTVDFGTETVAAIYDLKSSKLEVRALRTSFLTSNFSVRCEK